MTNAYQYWNRCHKGEATEEHLLPTLYAQRDGEPASLENPQPGLWQISVQGGYENGKKRPKRFALMQLWLAEPGDTERKAVHVWRPGLTIVGDIDGEPASEARIASHWLGHKFITKKTKEFYFLNGCRWPEDPPVVTAASAPALGDAAPPPAHNSNDLATFEGMRAQLLSECRDALEHFEKAPIATKQNADMCENWRTRIAKLAKQADEMRVVEKQPHLDACREVDAKWGVLAEAAKKATAFLKALVDRFDAAERDRLRKAAAAKARAEFEAEQKRRAEENARIEAEREAIAEANALLERDDPIAALTGSLHELPPLPEEEAAPTFVAPVFEAPKTLYGTGTEGNRRSASAGPATATITDLRKAAAYYADQQHPDLIALVQKLANKAAKARAAVPGVRMSWEHETAA